MHLPNPATTGAAETIIAAIRGLLTQRKVPVLIALDGPSGSGKSTLAGMVAEAVHATVVPSDDFYAAQITDAEWDARSPRDRAADAIDWRRLRREALEPLLAGVSAQWHSFDFDVGVRADGTYAMRADFTQRRPAAIIVLEGAYSTLPELADLIDLSVLVDAPVQLRQQRLEAREPESFLEAWHARWDPAEAYYFVHVRPPSSFNLVVSTVTSPTAR